MRRCACHPRPLKYEGAKSETVALAAALHHLVGRETVAFGGAVAASQTAVETVATAVAAELYETTYIYAKSELLTGSSDGIVAEKLKQRIVQGRCA